MNEQTQAEIQRILDLLRTLIRILGLPNREVERRIGLSPSYLSRLFGGYIEVKLEHVLEIARALGLRPGEFFELAYPDREEPPSEAAVKIRTVLTTLQPSRPVELAPRPASTEEIERRVQEALRQAFQELKRSAGGG